VVFAGRDVPITLHNFYVPAGGDEPDPSINEKFAHKLGFLERDEGLADRRRDLSARRSSSATSTSRRWSTMSGRTSSC
jgi:exonuclease III